MKNIPKSRVSFYLKSGIFHDPGSLKDTLLAKTLLPPTLSAVSWPGLGWPGSGIPTGSASSNLFFLISLAGSSVRAASS